MSEKWVDDVLAFWFGELGPKDWFRSSEETDRTIRERFASLHDRLRTGIPDAAMSDADTALAATIVYDQFPRNIHRGSASAFGTDMLALSVARNALDRGFDEGMNAQHKQFLYMPFMHSEVIADQERSVMLYRAMGNEDALKYAVDHRDIVVRFGRFPHRNRALGRETSRDEASFMEGHAGYGQ